MLQGNKSKLKNTLEQRESTQRRNGLEKGGPPGPAPCPQGRPREWWPSVTAGQRRPRGCLGQSWRRQRQRRRLAGRMLRASPGQHVSRHWGA